MKIEISPQEQTRILEAAGESRLHQLHAYLALCTQLGDVPVGTHNVVNIFADMSAAADATLAKVSADVQAHLNAKHADADWDISNDIGNLARDAGAFLATGLKRTARAGGMASAALLATGSMAAPPQISINTFTEIPYVDLMPLADAGFNISELQNGDVSAADYTRAVEIWERRLAYQEIVAAREAIER